MLQICNDLSLLTQGVVCARSAVSKSAAKAHVSQWQRLLEVSCCECDALRMRCFANVMHCECDANVMHCECDALRINVMLANAMLCECDALPCFANVMDECDVCECDA